MEIDKCTATCIIIFLGPSPDNTRTVYNLLEYLDDPMSIRPLVKVGRMDKLCSQIRFGFNSKIDTERCDQYGISLMEVMHQKFGSFPSSLEDMVRDTFPEWSKRFPQLSGSSYDQVKSVLGLTSPPPAFIRDHSETQDVFSAPFVLKGGLWFCGQPPFVDLVIVQINAKIWKDFLKRVFEYYSVSYSDKYWTNPSVTMEEDNGLAFHINVAYEFFKTKKDLRTCVGSVDDVWSGLVWAYGQILEKLELRKVDRKYHRFVDTTLKSL